MPSNKELRPGEYQLFQFLEAVPMALFLLDASGQPVFANKEAQRLLGKGVAPGASSDELAEVYQAYVAGTDQPYPSEKMPIVRALAGEISKVEDMEIRRPDDTVPLQVSAAPIFNEHGQLLYAIAAFNDITERVRTESLLRDLAVRDELTGLYNRRYMDHLLKEEVARCESHGSFTSLILLDLDHFKLVNDTHGHPVGDQVLRQVAHLVRTHVRAMDRSIRYGGEELAVVLPETTDSGAFIVAERIRKAVAAERFVDLDKPHEQDVPGLQVTVSLGVACLPSDANSAEALVAAADQALYEAKSQGRNRAVVFSKSQLRTAILDNHVVDVDGDDTTQPAQSERPT